MNQRELRRLVVVRKTVKRKAQSSVDRVRWELEILPTSVRSYFMPDACAEAPDRKRTFWHDRVRRQYRPARDTGDPGRGPLSSSWRNCSINQRKQLRLKVDSRNISSCFHFNWLTFNQCSVSDKMRAMAAFIRPN